MSFDQRFMDMWPQPEDLAGFQGKYVHADWAYGHGHLDVSIVRHLKPSSAPGSVYIYLHDPVSPFLRFVVRHPWARQIWCPTCSGSGRKARPEIQRVLLLSAVDQRDPVDENGQRRCLTCFGHGKVEARYGVGNDFHYTPNFDDSYKTAPPRNKEDILYVVQWCDDLLQRKQRKPTDPTEILGREEVMEGQWPAWATE